MFVHLRCFSDEIKKKWWQGKTQTNQHPMAFNYRVSNVITITILFKFYFRMEFGVHYMFETGAREGAWNENVLLLSRGVCIAGSACQPIRLFTNPLSFRTLWFVYSPNTNVTNENEKFFLFYVNSINWFDLQWKHSMAFSIFISSYCFVRMFCFERPPCIFRLQNLFWFWFISHSSLVFFFSKLFAEVI